MATHDNRGAQTGDQQHRDAAGGDINNVGMDPAAAFAALLDYIWRSDQPREQARHEHARRFDRLALVLGIVGAVLVAQTVALLSVLGFILVLLYPRLVAGW